MDDHMIYRCYGMMDSRGRWRAWRFGLAMPEVENLLTTEADIADHILFASVQTFAAPADTVGITRWRQIREQYVGENARPHLAPLFFDVDCDGDLDRALLWARTLVEFFIHQLDLPKSAVRVWFSGSKGAHILVNSTALGIEPSATLTADMKTVVLELVRHLSAQGADEMTIDRAVYSLPRMLRMPDQLNPRSGLYKVELRHSELFQLTADQIMDLARKPRGSLWLPKVCPTAPVPAAAEWWSNALTHVQESREFRIRTAEVAGLKVRPDGYVVDELITSDMPSCIEKMFKASVSPGNRNRIELQIACWAKGAKLSFNRALFLLSSWTTANRPELSSENAQVKAESIVRSVFGNSSYGFSCIAARSVARTVGVVPECNNCKKVYSRSLRQVHSLRVRHDAQWKSPLRISLEEARGITARIIDHRVAACRTDHPGRCVVRHRKNPRCSAGDPRTRNTGCVCSAHA